MRRTEDRITRFTRLRETVAAVGWRETRVLERHRQAQDALEAQVIVSTDERKRLEKLEKENTW